MSDLIADSRLGLRPAFCSQLALKLNFKKELNILSIPPADSEQCSLFPSSCSPRTLESYHYDYKKHGKKSLQNSAFISLYIDNNYVGRKNV